MSELEDDLDNFAEHDADLCDDPFCLLCTEVEVRCVECHRLFTPGTDQDTLCADCFGGSKP